MSIVQHIIRRSLLLLILAKTILPVLRHPLGGSPTQGSATFNTSGSTLTIHTSDRAAINWQSFNIAAGETTTFVQPPLPPSFGIASTTRTIADSGQPQCQRFRSAAKSNGLFVGGQAVISTHGLALTPRPFLA